MSTLRAFLRLSNLNMALKKASRKASQTRSTSIFLAQDGDNKVNLATEQPCLPPARIHPISYHRPLLLSSRESTDALLSWFDGTSSSRSMPWRKPFLRYSDHDKDDFPALQAVRAYEVWVSEIMLQQTRVSTVIPYFNNWISKWPTVHDLAKADQEDVLAAWKGLGYYSRATRLHEAAQQIVQDMNGTIPGDVEGLLQIKGIGRYTAGAVSSIAFGRASPLLDGNVSRVLSRQVGLHAQVKDKKVEDVLWDIATALIQYASNHSQEDERSDIPGRWNQGMMELGATICTPKPKCEECPIQTTCRAYAEGSLLTTTKKPQADANKSTDIEDLCQLCSPLELEDVEDAVDTVAAESNASSENGTTAKTTSRKRAATTAAIPARPAKKNSTQQQSTLLGFITPSVKSGVSEETAAPYLIDPTPSKPAISAASLTKIKAYCSLFPQRVIKKTVPTEQALVCIIRASDSQNKQQYLIEQRPPKGLLANLWQFPNTTFVPGDGQSEKALAKDRRDAALAYAQSLTPPSARKGYTVKLERKDVLGQITHVFSHLKLEMFVYSFVLVVLDEGVDFSTMLEQIIGEKQEKKKWLSAAGVDDATLGTGMQRCWKLHQES